jgi:hypothetical protein
LPVHDRGKVLVQMALVLAGGGESCLDIEHLRVGEDLLGSVPSDTTVARTFHEITPSVRSSIAEAVAKVRSEVWRASSATTSSDPVVVDIDASLVEVHSENKEETAPRFKGGFGFHPMFCFADASGETLAALLRAGNAGANTVADHLRVLDEAIAQLPEEVAAGIASTTTRALSSGRSSSAPTRPGAPKGSSSPAGPATSASSSRRGAGRRSPPQRRNGSSASSSERNHCFRHTPIGDVKRAG